MNRSLLLAMGLAVAGIAHAGGPVTFATFADPSLTSMNPLFTHDTVARTLKGGWSQSGLTLITPGLTGIPSATNATFQTSTLALTEVVPGVHSVGAGNVVFKDSNGAELFTIAFSGASYFEGAGVGSSEFRAQSITITGPQVPAGTVGSQFNFAFANQVNTQGKITYTASFTSSATPEPASMIALGAGIAAIVARRRRQA